MGNLKWMICTLTLFFSFSLRGQPDTAGAENNNTGQQTNQPAQNGREAQPNAADTTGTASAGNENETNGPDEASGDDNTTDEQTSNTPAVQQTTSSQSGSPAVLSGARGKNRDGTNNVQRASMNMVGSPAEDLNLDDNRTVDPDKEMKDRQEQTQEKQISAQNQSDGNASGGQSAEINEKTRRENNALSGQNLSAKDKRNQNVQRNDAGDAEGESGKKRKRKKN